MALFLRYAVRSDLGLVRNNNEDSVYAGPRLLAIADGMGGHAAGEVASKIVISSLEHLDEDRRIDDLAGELRDTVLDSNRRIADAVTQRKELEGMGTTLTALRFVGAQVGMVHVGDSRAYLLRDGQLSQITHDDTYVQYLVDSGKLTPDEAKDHPRKSVILRALLGTDVELDVTIREASAGDRYLLCSDGLSDVVSTETIADTLQIEDPQESADRLVELALRGGGPDNVTVIVADVLNARAGDHIDDVPVIAGAFVDPAAADVPGADSAAERAARMARPAPTDPVTPVPPAGRSRSWRGWLLGLAVVIVLAGALVGVYVWAQTQYFVARDGRDVAIFQGVNTAFGPLKFYSVDHVESGLPVATLCQADKSRVEEGITASSRSDATSIVARLQENKRDNCPPEPTNPCPASSLPFPITSGAPTSPTPTPTPSRTPTGTRTGVPRTTSKPAAAGAARLSAERAARSAEIAARSSDAARRASLSAAAESSSAAAAASSTPGCR